MNKREQEFNNILDECLDRLIFKGEPAEQCLSDYPEMADELRPLLETALVTSSIIDLKPDSAFRSKARAEMHSVLRQAEEKKERSVFGFAWRRGLVTALSVLLVVFAVTGGTAAASSRAMPDSFLYPVKLATEKVQLAFTFTDLGKAEANARIADKRVEEIVYLANQENPDAEEIDVLATNLNTNLLNIATYSSKTQDNSVKTAKTAGEERMMTATAEDVSAMQSVDEDENSVGLMATPEAVTGEGSESKETTEADSSTPKAAPSPEITVELPPSAITVAPEVGTRDTSADPRQILNTTLTNQAVTNLSRLYELLRIVPISIRPVIEKAIVLAEEGYNIAINSLY